MMIWKVGTAVILYSVAGLASVAQAQERHPELSDTHTFILGAYSQESDTEIGARRPGSGGEYLDLSDLGVDDSDVTWTLAYRWRFAERWTLSLGTSVFEVDGDLTLTETIDYNGKEFEAGVKLESDFSADTYVMDVMYSAYKSDRAEFLVGGGLHAFDFSVKLKGTVFVEDESRTATASSDDLLAPLPNLRMHGFYAFTPAWAVHGTLGWMSANIDSWDGDYVYASVRTDYRFGKRFGIGVGYQFVEVDISHEGKRVDSAFDVGYHGPTLYLVYGF